jgi:hypothetical protein
MGFRHSNLQRLLYFPLQNNSKKQIYWVEKYLGWNLYPPPQVTFVTELKYAHTNTHKHICSRQKNAGVTRRSQIVFRHLKDVTR